MYPSTEQFQGHLKALCGACWPGQVRISCPFHASAPHKPSTHGEFPRCTQKQWLAQGHVNPREPETPCNTGERTETARSSTWPLPIALKPEQRKAALALGWSDLANPSVPAPMWLRTVCCAGWQRDPSPLYSTCEITLGALPSASAPPVQKGADKLQQVSGRPPRRLGQVGLDGLQRSLHI